MFPMNPIEAIDIDTEIEFRLAESVAPSFSARFAKPPSR
jgi:CMP-N-acetylneuraminic acid synthetase